MFLLLMLFVFVLMAVGLVMETLYSSDSKKPLLGWIALGTLWSAFGVYFVLIPNLDTCSAIVDTASCVLLMWAKQ